MKHPIPYRRMQVGASLIEVLIAVLILSIGMLGVAAMQTVSLRNSQSAFDRTQATVLSYAILDAMRANPGAARGVNYNTGGLICEDSPSAAQGLVKIDHDKWVDSLVATMGESACGRVACNAGVCRITVQWDDSRGSGDGSEEGDLASTEQQIVTETRI